MREVELAAGLWVHERMISHRQWEHLMGGNPTLAPKKRGSRGNYPIDMVNWFAAAAYCNALSRAEGLEEAYDQLSAPATLHGQPNTPNHLYFNARFRWKGFHNEGYRLPTPVEWEIFARAGCRQNWYGPPEEVAWFGGRLSEGSPPLGVKRPNLWGVHDTIGLMWEWTMHPLGNHGGSLGSTFQQSVLFGGSWTSGFWQTGYEARIRRPPL